MGVESSGRRGKAVQEGFPSEGWRVLASVTAREGGPVSPFLWMLQDRYRVWERTVVTGLLRNRCLCLGYRVLQKCVPHLTWLNSGLVCGNVCQDSYVTRVVGSPVRVEGDSCGVIWGTPCRDWGKLRKSDRNLNPGLTRPFVSSKRNSLTRFTP